MANIITIFTKLALIKTKYITTKVSIILLIVSALGIWPTHELLFFIKYKRGQTLKALSLPYIYSGVEEPGVLARPITSRSHGSNPASAIIY